MNRISVIIPCYNEEKSIGEVIKKIPREVFEIIVVDNNSTDRTAEFAKKLGAKVITETKQGYGFAIKKGFRKAKGEIIVTLDGDGQYPAEKTLELVEYLEKNNLDFLNASRFPLKNKNSLPSTRIVGNYFLTFLTNFLFGSKIKDSQSGMMIFKKGILEKIKLESGDMPISQELKIKTFLSGFKFGEINIPYYPRQGESKLSPLKHGFKNSLALLKLKSQTKNFKSIYILGLILVLFIYGVLATKNLNKPFVNVTSDTNGENGLAVLNWQNIGIFNLKFGKFTNGYLNKENFNFDSIKGKFYAHHPIFYLFPTYFLYKIFGVSELTTRAGPFLMFIIGIIFFYFALIKIFKNFLYPFLITLLFVILPGTVYYGTTFELAVFSLPTALITFSLFVFYYFTKRDIYFYFLIFSIFLGGLMGWFYFFMPAAIWLYLLFDKNYEFQKEKRKLLMFLPIISIFVFSLNLFHIYLLNGNNGFLSLKESFIYRTQRFPFRFWIKDIQGRMGLNFTNLFLITFILGLLIFFINFKKYKILTPLLLMPLINLFVFYQWSTHPFGVIFFLPIIATFTGIFLIYLYEKNKNLGISVIILILLLGGYFSYQKLDFFTNKFLILGKKDTQLLKELKNQVNDNEICLGRNQMGLYYGGIVMWYLRKDIEQSPNCKTAKAAIVFHPSLGKFYQKELNAFQSTGFKPLGCADLWCLLVKK